jgi:hypothetical protein
VAGLARLGDNLLAVCTVSAELRLALLRMALKRKEDGEKPRQDWATAGDHNGTLPYLLRAHRSPLPAFSLTGGKDNACRGIKAGRDALTLSLLSDFVLSAHH